MVRGEGCCEPRTMAAGADATQPVDGVKLITVAVAVALGDELPFLRRAEIQRLLRLLLHK